MANQWNTCNAILFHISKVKLLNIIGFGYDVDYNMSYLKQMFEQYNTRGSCSDYLGRGRGPWAVGRGGEHNPRPAR